MTTPTHRPDPWAQALGDYAIEMRAAGRALGTIRLHRYRLLELAELVADPWAVTTGDLIEFLGREHWMPETRKSVRTSLRSFFGWAFDAGHMAENPAARLRPVKVPTGAPRPAPEPVIAAALDACDERVALMIRLAAFGGLRAAEVAQVHSDHVVDGLLRVRGKGGKTRDVPLVPVLVEELAKVEDWAFPNGRGSHLTAGHVTKLVSEALPEGWTCHTLRHRMATTAYAGTRDLLAVGSLLGHSRPETTQRYVRMPQDALRAAIEHVERLAGATPFRADLIDTRVCPAWCQRHEDLGMDIPGVDSEGFAHARTLLELPGVLTAQLTMVGELEGGQSDGVVLIELLSPGDQVAFEATAERLRAFAGVAAGAAAL